MRKYSRDRSQAELQRIVAPNERCPFCDKGLAIVETRERYVQTLTKFIHLVLKGKSCSSKTCAHTALRYRPLEEGRIVLKGHEFGLDVVVFSGEHHLRHHLSIPRIHKLLRGEHHVPICERNVGNLIDDYMALCECVAGDTDRLRTRLKQQGAMVLSIDGVQHDDRSAVLYVQREVMSGEVLYAERRLARGADDLAPMLQRTAQLAQDIEVPIVGITSDKEHGLVGAIAKVFPEVAHGFCHQHFLGNVAKPVEADDRKLAEGVRQIVSGLREVRRGMERESIRPGVPAACTAPTDSVAAQPVGELAATPWRVAAENALEPGERQVAQALALAATTGGIVCGRPSVDPEGLKRFHRLQEVREAARQAALKKGVPPAAGL